MPRAIESSSTTTSRAPIPALTVSGIFSPVTGDAHRLVEELRDLPNGPAVQMRRAYIRLSSGNHTRAIRDLNRLLYGESALTPMERAFAHFLVALAHDRKGDRERHDHDLAEAIRLAGTSELGRHIAAEYPPPSTAAPAPAPVMLLARSDWDAAPSRPSRMVRMTDVHRITVHHSAVLARSESSRHSAAVVRAIQRDHMGNQGWGDIGYHYLIDREGRVFTGRPTTWQGAHAGNSTTNKGNIGVCLLGNFVRERDGQNPSERQIAALESVLAQLCARYRVSPGSVLTHRELKHNTVCPGARLQVAVERMRQALVSRAARRRGLQVAE